MLLKRLQHQALICALLAFCLLLSACFNSESSLITEQQVSAFLAEWDQAMQSGDIGGVASHLSPNVICESEIDGSEQQRKAWGNYDDFIKTTASDFKNVKLFEYKRGMTLIMVEPDGQSASVKDEVHQAVTFGGKFFRLVTISDKTIKRQEGKLVITSMRYSIHRDSENRLPFQ